MDDKGQIYKDDNSGQNPAIQNQTPVNQGQITSEAVHDDNIQAPNLNNVQVDNTQSLDVVSDEKAIDKLISLGVILLAVSLAIAFLYLFSSTGLVENITSYF